MVKVSHNAAQSLSRTNRHRLDVALRKPKEALGSHQDCFVTCAYLAHIPYEDKDMHNIAVLLIAALILSSTGCVTTMQPLGKDLPVTVAVEQGDKVEITDTDGYTSTFTVENVTEKTIAGSNEDGVNVAVEIDHIDTINIERIDGVKTALTVVGVIVVVPIIIAGVLVLALAGFFGGELDMGG